MHLSISPQGLDNLGTRKYKIFILRNLLQPMILNSLDTFRSPSPAAKCCCKAQKRCVSGFTTLMTGFIFSCCLLDETSCLHNLVFHGMSNTKSTSTVWGKKVIGALAASKLWYLVYCFNLLFHTNKLQYDFAFFLEPDSCQRQKLKDPKNKQTCIIFS